MSCLDNRTRHLGANMTEQSIPEPEFSTSLKERQGQYSLLPSTVVRTDMKKVGSCLSVESFSPLRGQSEKYSILFL